MSKRAVKVKKPLSRSSIHADEINFLQTDVNGIVISSSEQLSAFIGAAGKTLVGTSLTDIVVKNDSSKLAAFLNKEKNAGTDTISITIQGMDKSRTFNFTVQCIPDASSQQFLLSWNINPKHSPTGLDEVRSLDSLFGSNPQPVLIFDPVDQKIVYVNTAACGFYNFQKEQFLQLDVSELVSPRNSSDGNKNNLFPLGTHSYTKKNAADVQVNLFISSVVIEGSSFHIAFTEIPPLSEDVINLTDGDTSHNFSLPENALGDATEVDSIKTHENTREAVSDAPPKKYTENILKESKRHFRYLADAVPAMIWVTDENNIPYYVSKGWSDLTGKSIETIISEGWKDILHPEDHDFSLQQYTSYLNSRLPFVIEYRLRLKDGDYKWVLDHGVPRFTADGVYMGYVGSVIDIHYRKTAEQKLRYQERMIENIRDAIVSTDLDLNIIAWNSMAEEIYGLTKEEVMGRHIRSIITHEYISVTRESVLIELYEKDSWQGEVYFDRKDGKRIYLFIALSFVKNEKGERIGLVGIHRDITQHHEAELALRISEERYRSVVDALTEGILLQNSEGKIIACNRAATSILGNELVGSHFNTGEWQCIKEDGTRFSPEEDPLTITMHTGKPLQGTILGLQLTGKAFYWFSVNTEPIYYSSSRLAPDAVVTSLVDITERKHQEQWLSLEKDVLEVNALPSATLKNTVDFYVKGLEKMFPDMICSILMLRDDKKSMQHLSAPSLPTEYSEAVNGVRIGPGVGSCGTAMYLKQRVITYDINTDPLWADYRNLTAKFNLRSCWSFPILNAQNEVLATLAAYHKYPKVPTDRELNIMEVGCNLLKIIFENKYTEANLRLSNERYLLATKATHDAIYDWDIIENTVYRGESFYTLFGYNTDQVGNIFEFLEAKLHPADKSKIITSLEQFIENRSPDIWECEYRILNAFGKYAVVYDRGFLVFNNEGKIIRLVGSMMDITERKELEKKLVKQEVDKQKLVAQAVVNAQEKERADIGKELHDNVNQILSTARLYLELARNDEKERMNLIQRSYDSIYDAINEIRNISRSLVPPSVGDLGLIESIEDLVENTKATQKLYIEFCHEGEIDQLLGQKQKLMLFRIIQEQVSNVLKHANANHIIIELMIDGNMINLAVSDDGKGFDVEEVKNNRGVGLQNIASRTELFNGNINIVTAPDKGCKLNIHVPISKL